MGPRLFSCGNTILVNLDYVVGVRLQWGRGFSAAEIDPKLMAQIEANRLQWGRGFSAAEMRMEDRHAATSLASMGPRLFSRGNKKVEKEKKGRRQRFNGAAAFQPRKSANVTPRWLARSAASMGPRLFSRGNIPERGADAGGAGLQWGRGFSAAEMTPEDTGGNPTLDSFNGAAAFQPRKSSRDWRCRGRHTGFNGAAAFQPRKWRYRGRRS